MGDRTEKGRFAKGNKLGTPWPKGKSGNPKGRKKKIYNQIKESGYSADDLRTAFFEIVWLTEGEVEEILFDPEKPMIIKVLAKTFLKARQEGDFSKIKEIMEQSMGRPKSTVDLGVTNKVEIVDLSHMSEEKVDELYAQFEAARLDLGEEE